MPSLPDGTRIAYRRGVARVLLLISVVAFAVTGVGYLVVPGTMLSVVGITSVATTDFLIRTEGVALVTAAVLIWSVREAPPGTVRMALLGLTFYYVVGSIVDLGAFASAIVGPASVPSALVRIVLGLGCAYAATRQRSVIS
jgi:hypothetical protein